MARKYRQLNRISKVTGPNGGQPFVRIEPLDNDQAPPGYIDKVKVTVLNEGELTIHQPIMVYASTTDVAGTGFMHMITAQGIGQGSGTAWLSLKRSIRSDDSEPQRSDGQICIWVEAANQTSVTCVVEAWGRFIELDNV